MTLPVPISFEFFPPNTPVGDEKLKGVVRELGALQPEFFSVTYGAGGSTRDKTLHTVQAIAAAGFEAPSTTRSSVTHCATCSTSPTRSKPVRTARSRSSSSTPTPISTSSTRCARWA